MTYKHTRYSIHFLGCSGVGIFVFDAGGGGIPCTMYSMHGGWRHLHRITYTLSTQGGSKVEWASLWRSCHLFTSVLEVHPFEWMLEDTYTYCMNPNYILRASFESILCTICLTRRIYRLLSKLHSKRATVLLEGLISDGRLL